MLGVYPTLLHFTSNRPNARFRTLPHNYGEVIPIPRPGIFWIGLEAKYVRLWATYLFPNDICILSDIDLLPLFIPFFEEALDRVTPNNIVYTKLTEFSRKDFEPKNLPVPMDTRRVHFNYVMGYGKTLSKAFLVKGSFREFCFNAYRYGYRRSGDEVYLNDRLMLTDFETVFFNSSHYWSTYERRHGEVIHSGRLDVKHLDTNDEDYNKTHLDIHVPDLSHTFWKEKSGLLFNILEDSRTRWYSYADDMVT
jgi:hypothetical protein